MIAISPYAIRSHISHTLYTFDSLSAYIERLWKIGCLRQDDCSATDVSDMLNYRQPPVEPITLKTRPVARSTQKVVVDGRDADDD